MGRKKQRRMKKRRQRRNETTEEEEREGGDHHQKGGKKAALLCFLLLLLLSRFFLSFPFCLSPSLPLDGSVVRRALPEAAPPLHRLLLGLPRCCPFDASPCLPRPPPPSGLCRRCRRRCCCFARRQRRRSRAGERRQEVRPSVRRLLGPPLPTAPLSLLGLSVQGEYRVLAIGGGELSSSRWPPRTDRPTDRRRLDVPPLQLLGVSITHRSGEFTQGRPGKIRGEGRKKEVFVPCLPACCKLYGKQEEEGKAHSF